MTDFVPWLRGLAEQGGKGFVNNIAMLDASDASPMSLNDCPPPAQGWPSPPTELHWLGDRESADATRHATDVTGCVMYFQQQGDCLQFMRWVEALCTCGGGPGQPSDEHDISCPVAILPPSQPADEQDISGAVGVTAVGGRVMARHEQSVGATSEWYTPPHVFNALGCAFDMDVASPGRAVTPWIPAAKFIERDSLTEAWEGFIWMNPPFGGRNALAPWLEKFFAHGNGIALVPDRTSAPWWQQFVPCADLTLFIAKKIRFIGGREAADLGLVEKPGDPGKAPAQGTCLLASGKRAIAPLCRASTDGLGVLMSPALPSHERQS